MTTGTFIIIHQHGQYDQETKTVLTAVPFTNETHGDCLKLACVTAIKAVRMLCLCASIQADLRVRQYPEGADVRKGETREQYARRVWLNMTNWDDDDAVLVVQVPSPDIIDEIFRPKRDNPNDTEAEGRFEHVVRRYPVDPSLYWDGVPLEPQTPEEIAADQKEMARRRLLLAQAGPENFMATGYVPPTAG